jgi:hypothetical protein
MHQVVQLPPQLQVDIGNASQSQQRLLINSFLIHRDLAIIGTTSGQILKYRLQDSGGATLLNSYRFASEKPIDALLVVHDWLFCLCSAASSTSLSGFLDLHTING